MSGVYCRAGMECRCSGARRGIGSIRAHWRSPRGCRGCWRPLGASGGLGGVVGVRDVLGSWQGV